MPARKEPTDFGRAVGQIVGKLVERKITRVLRKYPIVPHEKWRNRYNLRHEIDYVIGTRETPIILLETRWLKYTKHARENAGHIASFLNGVRDSHKTVQECVAVLAGSWTRDSLRVLENTNVKVFHFPFDIVSRNLARYDIVIDWAEDDKETSMHTWRKLNSLSEKKIDSLADAIFEGTDIVERLEKMIERVLREWQDKSRWSFFK